MTMSGVFQEAARTCIAISNDVADQDGFVSVPGLLTRFRARLVLRPLLVEGMVAVQYNSHSLAAENSGWVVLADSETYPVTQEDVGSETGARPLPDRFRYTVAHELAHSLAFRPSEFGFSLKTTPMKPTSPEWVRMVERETDRLSPLLVCSEALLRRLLACKSEPVSVADLATARRSAAISRYVLVSRLRTLWDLDPQGFLVAPGLLNLAVGIGEWVHDGRAVLRSWPLFANFHRNLIPGFIREILRQDRLPAEAIFGAVDFAMCGGSNRCLAFVADAGTQANPRATKLGVEVTVESGPRSPGRQFLFVVRSSLQPRT